MGERLLQAVAVLVSRLQRAAKRMRMASRASKPGSPSSSFSSTVTWTKKAFSMPPSPAKARTRRDEEAGGLWRKEILMGERCQPLDFSGVIYYDAEGRRLAHPPPPRSPMRSPIPASPRLAAATVGRYC